MRVPAEGHEVAAALDQRHHVLGELPVPRLRTVLYVALEGSRAGLRARFGCVARGMRIDPGGDALAALHIAYKPRGASISCI